MESAEARHGKAFKGLPERYFGKQSHRFPQGRTFVPPCFFVRKPGDSVQKHNKSRIAGVILPIQTFYLQIFLVIL